jgi:hypothetical protein
LGKRVQLAVKALLVEEESRSNGGLEFESQNACPAVSNRRSSQECYPVIGQELHGPHYRLPDTIRKLRYRKPREAV